jgi:hypothetical protein
MMASHQGIRGADYRLKLVLAWGSVGIPLIWGVVETLVNVVKAFH